MIRLRLLFGKTVWMRYTAHLDTQRTLERTIRRAQLPLAYSEGFTPHAKIHFASALPLGCTSIGELADIWLTEEIAAEECLSALIRSAPPGLTFFRVWNVPLNEAELQNKIQSAEYRCFLLTNQDQLRQRIEALLAATSLPHKRRGREIDLRLLIEQLYEENDPTNSIQEDGVARQAAQQCIAMRLKAGEGASGRPDEVLEALAIPLHEAQIQRVRIILRD